MKAVRSIETLYFCVVHLFQLFSPAVHCFGNWSFKSSLGHAKVLMVKSFYQFIFHNHSPLSKGCKLLQDTIKDMHSKVSICCELE